MKIRYFVYIADWKVQMFLEQLDSKKFSLTKISPKLSMAGIGISAEVGRDDRKKLVSDTINLVDQLEKKNLLHDLTTSTELSTSDFYHDVGEWYNGLLTFGFRGDTPCKAYFLWTTRNDKLLLLVGSPGNLLSEKGIKQSEYVYYGTDTSFARLWSYIKGAGLELDSGPLQVEPLRVHSNPEFSRSVKAVDILTFCLHTTQELPESRVEAFCLGTTKQLPRTKVETVFTVLNRMDVAANQASDLNRSVHALRQVYIGTPIFTALG